MKEVFEAIKNRINTPYFGYSILAFIALNWRGFFYLIFTKGTPDERLDTFDLHTSLASLIIYPLIIGGLIAISFHWLRYFFSKMEIKPRQLYENIQLEAENNKIIMQTQLELTRAESLKLKEEELIDRADRDNKVANIENPEIQNRIKDELNTLRKENEIVWVDGDGHKTMAPKHDSHFLEILNDYNNLRRTGRYHNDYFLTDELKEIFSRINNFPNHLLNLENRQRFNKLKIDINNELIKLHPE
jgi:hypothetical protein